MGGMFGNLLDRIIHHGVIDFIYIKIINFPVFNIADIGITLGVVLLLISSIIDKKKQIKK